jgi:hypothetical protein
LPRGAWPHPRPAELSGILKIGSSKVLVCTICHNVLNNARHGIDLLVVHGCGWYRLLQLQKLLLEVGDHLHPCLKLSLLHLEGMLKVDDPVGTDIHLLPSDVEQLTDVVPPILGLTKSTVSDL